MASILVAGDTSGSVTISAPAVSGSSVLTLPAVTDTLVGLSATQTLTNKTLTAPVLGTPASGALTNCTSIPGAQLTGTVAAARLPAGSVVQVIQSVYITNTQINSSTFVTTTHAVTITPNSASNKVMVFLSGGGAWDTNTAGFDYMTTIYRGATRLDTLVHGSADGLEAFYFSGYGLSPHSIQYLDSPATTAATTYTVYAKASGANPYSYVWSNKYPVTLTVWEIVA